MSDLIQKLAGIKNLAKEAGLPRLVMRAAPPAMAVSKTLKKAPMKNALLSGRKDLKSQMARTAKLRTMQKKAGIKGALKGAAKGAAVGAVASGGAAAVGVGAAGALLGSPRKLSAQVAKESLKNSGRQGAVGGALLGAALGHRQEKMKAAREEKKQSLEKKAGIGSYLAKRNDTKTESLRKKLETSSSKAAAGYSAKSKRGTRIKNTVKGAIVGMGAGAAIGSGAARSNAERVISGKVGDDHHRFGKGTDERALLSGSQAHRGAIGGAIIGGLAGAAKANMYKSKTREAKHKDDAARLSTTKAYKGKKPSLLKNMGTAAGKSLKGSATGYALGSLVNQGFSRAKAKETARSYGGVYSSKKGQNAMAGMMPNIGGLIGAHIGGHVASKGAQNRQKAEDFAAKKRKQNKAK